MDTISGRLSTFKDKWPAVKCSPEDLAEAGFFYLEEGDKVQCPFCCIVISNWSFAHKPLREHMRNQPLCPFLLETAEKELFTKTPKEIILPRHPRMVKDNQRFLTFSTWPLTKPDSRELVECGFFYSGVRDVVICFYCDVSLGEWKREDDPWKDHEKYSKNCEFLKRGRGLSKTNKSIECRNISKVLLCKLCMDKERNILFQPCGHCVSCNQCAMYVEDCPICRKSIIYKIKTYLS
jgi:hypothetical protein